MSTLDKLRAENAQLEKQAERRREERLTLEKQLAKLITKNAGLKKAEQASKRSEKAPADSVVHIVGEPADMNALDTPKPTVKAKPAPKRT